MTFLFSQGRSSLALGFSVFVLAFANIGSVGAAVIAQPVIEYLSSDAEFLGRLNPGRPSNESHIAIGEFRWGNNALNGDWEFAAGFPTSSGSQTQGNHVWGGSPVAASIDYDGGTALSVTLDSSTRVYDDPSVSLGSFNSLSIRANGSRGDVFFTSLTINGQSIGDLSVTDGVRYMIVSGFDLTQPLSIAGMLAFNDDITNRGSAPALQVKVSDLQGISIVTAEVPVPLTLPLLATGIAALLIVRRRRSLI